MRAGAGAADVKVARAAAEAGDRRAVASFAAFPGTIGGALRMNGGAYGGETKDVLVEARGVDRARARSALFSWPRWASPIGTAASPEDVIFTQALFEGRPGDPAAILAEMNAITEARAGDPAGQHADGRLHLQEPAGAKAWELSTRRAAAACAIGDAQVSELHCNFLIAHAGATAADVEGLGEEVRRRVRESTRRRAANGRSSGSERRHAA